MDFTGFGFKLKVIANFGDIRHPIGRDLDAKLLDLVFDFNDKVVAVDCFKARIIFDRPGTRSGAAQNIANHHGREFVAGRVQRGGQASDARTDNTNVGHCLLNITGGLIEGNSSWQRLPLRYNNGIMFKTIRNTTFTVLVVLLTSFGLKWNSNTLQTLRPAGLNQAVLASQTFGQNSPDFPLKISFNSPEVRLGQAETVTITSVPGATLEVITQYPDGSTDHPQTFQTTLDSNGSKTFSILIPDFHLLGQYRVSVVASAGTKTTEVIGQFAIIPWAFGTSATENGTVYPLVP